MAKFKGAILVCETCGKEFKIPACRANRAKYCSMACAGVGRGKAREMPKVAIACAECGNIFFERQCHASRRVHCSKECMDSSAAHRAKLSNAQTGCNNGMWSGGTSKHPDGYVYEYAKGHPFASGSKNYVLQHRLVAERTLRASDPASPVLVNIAGELYLRPEYIVHHKDEDKKNNDAGNLVITTNSNHIKLHNALRRKQKNRRTTL